MRTYWGVFLPNILPSPSNSSHDKRLVVSMGILTNIKLKIDSHMLSCKMALLHPSTNIQYVETQKDKLDWSGQNTIDGNDYWYIISWPVEYIFI